MGGSDRCRGWMSGGPVKLLTHLLAEEEGAVDMVEEGMAEATVAADTMVAAVITAVDITAAVAAITVGASMADSSPGSATTDQGMAPATDMVRVTGMATGTTSNTTISRYTRTRNTRGRLLRL